MRPADLHGSTKNYIKNGGDFGKGEGKSYAGRNVLYGIREHVSSHYTGLIRFDTKNERSTGSSIEQWEGVRACAFLL